jgi:hypothetical protein
LNDITCIHKKGSRRGERPARGSPKVTKLRLATREKRRRERKPPPIKEVVGSFADLAAGGASL